MSTAVGQLVFGDVAQEFNRTRALLDAIPDEHFSWKPHEKSMSVGDLANHLVGLLDWNQMSIEQDEVDVAAFPQGEDKPSSRAELVGAWDAKAPGVIALFESLEESKLSDMWTLKKDGEPIFSVPRSAVLRDFGVNHMAHHRGQLTVYLRLLDVPLPQVYGPTADDPSF